MAKILLVTSDVTVVPVWQNILQSAGYQVDVAISGEEAVRRALSGGPVLMVVDQREVEKEAIIKQIKQNIQTRFLPVVSFDLFDVIEQKSALSKVNAVLQKKRILIAEDDRNMAGILKEVLGRQRFDVRLVFDGAEALKETKTWKPHVLVLDIMLPIIDGFHLCQQMNEDVSIEPKPKILIISGRESDWDKNLGAACGAEYYLVKPIDHMYFLEKVQELLSD